MIFFKYNLAKKDWMGLFKLRIPKTLYIYSKAKMIEIKLLLVVI